MVTAFTARQANTASKPAFKIGKVISFDSAVVMGLLFETCTAVRGTLQNVGTSFESTSFFVGKMNVDGDRKSSDSPVNSVSEDTGSVCLPRIS